MEERGLRNTLLWGDLWENLVEDGGSTLGGVKNKKNRIFLKIGQIFGKSQKMRKNKKKSTKNKN